MLTVGKAIKAHGIRGDIKAECYMDEAAMFSSLKVLYFDGNAYEVEKTRSMGNFLLIKLSGVDTMDDAEKFRGKEIFARKTDLPQPKEGRYYIDDLVGSTVVNECGERLGLLKQILQYGSADVYLMSDRGKTVMFPLIDGVVKSVDIVKKVITVDSLEYSKVAVYED